MKRKCYTVCYVGMLALLAATTSGCIGVSGPGIGWLSVPAPVLPGSQQKAEDHDHEQRYKKVAILPPITEEFHIALDPPPDDEVIRALEKVRPVGGSMPGLETTVRNVKGITKELIADFVDPPRVIPLVGPVQLHHAHYKCTVYFQEVTQVGWPVPHQVRVDDGIEVLYIDKDHFHRVGGGDAPVPDM